MTTVHAAVTPTTGKGTQPRRRPASAPHAADGHGVQYVVQPSVVYGRQGSTQREIVMPEARVSPAAVRAQLDFSMK